MTTLSLLTLLINVVILVVVFNMLKRIDRLNKENLTIQTNIEALVRESSEITDLILDDLELKLQEARDTIDFFEKSTFTVPEPEATLPFDNKIPKVKKDTRRSTVQRELIPELPNLPTLEASELLRQGLSFQEVAAKLNTTPGELALKLNLQQKLKIIPAKQE